MDTTTITTGRLVLRPWERRDAPAVAAACRDPEVQRWTTVPAPYDRGDAEQWCTTTSPALWDSGTAAPFAVLEAVTGDVVASVGLHEVDAAGRAEIGYWCAPAFRGHGYVTEAVQALCRWGFGAVGLQRIGWEAEVGNAASRAVAERSGFMVEGHQRRRMLHRGVLVDCWVGALLPGDAVVDRRPFGSWRDLSDGTVSLRKWRPDDLPVVLEALSDPVSARFLDVPVPYTEHDARAFLDNTALRWAEGQAAALCVEVAGRAAALVVLLPQPRERDVAEVGWWTTPSARGRGAATGGLRLLLQWAAREGVRRVTAIVDPANAASLAVAEAGGLGRIGTVPGGLRSQRGERPGDALLLGRLLPAPVR